MAARFDRGSFVLMFKHRPTYSGEGPAQKAFISIPSFPRDSQVSRAQNPVLL